MTELNVHEYGDRSLPTLVLLHGVTDDGSNWPDAVDRWQGRYHVLAVDQRGHGLSPRFDETTLADMDAAWTDDVVGLLDELAEPAVLIGHSLGGRIALMAGLARPERVAGLVLEDPALRDGQTEQERQAFIEGQRSGLAGFADGGDSVLEGMRREVSWSESELVPWAASKRRVDPGMIDNFRFGPMDRAGSLNAVTRPTLVLSDADGGLQIPEGEVDNPLVRIERLDGVGHCIRRDDPELFHGLVDPFLAEVTGGAAS